MAKTKGVTNYIVIGSGMITTDKIAITMRLVAKIIAPIPAYSFASTMEKAEEIANRFRLWHDQVIIAKVINITDKG